MAVTLLPPEIAMPDQIAKRAQRFTRDLMEHHDADLHDSEERRNAVIIKSVALLVLAYDIPAVTGAELDVEDAIDKLRYALGVLE